jgi:RNA polymerase sigma factor (TIGR02999 family)
VSSPRTLTRLLQAWSAGDSAAEAELFALVYDDLRRRAAAYLRQERAAHTLQPTALVNEVYLRLAAQAEGDWPNRAKFFALAATMMHRVLVDHARRHRRDKRGGGSWCRVPLADDSLVAAPLEADLLDLDDALRELERLDPRQARLVVLRFFGGLSIAEAAAVVGVSTATANREWSFARAWLFRALAAAGEA